MPKDHKKTILLVAWLALLGVLFFAITRLNNMVPPPGPNPAPPPRMTAAELQRRWPEIVARAAAPPRGDPRAAYTLVEFGDFQCPQCGKVRPIVEGLLAQAHDRVNLLFFHRPLTNLHEWALPAAEASEAAAAQGKFWPMYDTLYGHQDDLEPGYYDNYAAAAGLNVPAFRAALASHRYGAKVAQASQLADSLKIVETPTFLVRDNATGRLTLYVGMDNTQPGAESVFPGIKQLAARPPWRAAPKTAQE